MELISRWKISVGDVSEWLPQLLYAAAILISTWVLADARRRALPSYAVIFWTLAALVSPPIVLPLYLITRIFTPKRAANAQTLEASTSPADTEPDNSPARAQTSDDGATPESTLDDADQQVAVQPSAEPRAHIRGRLALPVLYALVLLSAGAIYFYRDYHSFDAHLARAANARLRNDRAAAIREYRAALRLSDDAHTHKLLAVQLTDDGQLEAALAELRAAARGGEPDELLPLRTAHVLDTLGKTAEAHLEYQKFLRGNLCARQTPDALCAQASARADQIQNER